jgi:hypothetical protein
MLNLITALIAYAHQPKKPSLKLDNTNTQRTVAHQMVMKFEV